MFERILFPTDGSETIHRPLEYVIDIAAFHDGTVQILGVVETDPAVSEESSPDRRRVVEGFVNSAADRVTEGDVPAETTVRSGSVADSIVAVANGDNEGNGVDLVGMATHGQAGVERVLLGSVTERVVLAADCPVLTVNPTIDSDLVYPARRILVPTDGSRHATEAVRLGARVARTTGANLHILHVVDTARFGLDGEEALPAGERDALMDRASEILEDAHEVTRAEDVPEPTTSIETGRPFRKIRSSIDTADVDLVVLGVRGSTDFSRSTLGGVTSKLLRTARVPLLITRDGA